MIHVKRYALFAYDEYDSGSPWENFVGLFDSVGAAKEAYDGNCLCAQVVDLLTLSEVSRAESCNRVAQWADALLVHP